MSDSLTSLNHYKDLSMRVPRYRYAKVNLNNLSSSSVTWSNTSSTLLEWKLSANTVFNLARSYISYQYTVPASGTGTTLGRVNDCDGSEFRSVNFSTGSGIPMVDLQYSDVSKTVLNPIKTKLTDMLTNDKLSGFYASNDTVGNNPFPCSQTGTTDISGATTNGAVNYIEPNHILSADNAAINVSRFQPLSILAPDTLLSVDKDLVFGVDTYLRLFTNYQNRFVWYQSAAPAITYPAAITFSNVFLYLAVEENIDIRNSLLSSLASGSIKLTIPYLYTYRFSSAATSSSANLSLTLTKNYGKNVKRILYVPMNGQELVGPYAFDHCNSQGCKVAQLQTSLDARPLTDYILNCYNPNGNATITGGYAFTFGTSSFADDWREIQNFVDGSCVQTYKQYQSKWWYADHFGVVPTKCPESSIPTWMVSDGFDLLSSGDHIYSIQANTSAVGNNANSSYLGGLLHYIIVLFTRTLHIQSDGIVLTA